MIIQKDYFNHFQLKVNTPVKPYSDLNFDTTVNDYSLIEIRRSLEPKASQKLFQHNSP